MFDKNKTKKVAAVLIARLKPKADDEHKEEGDEGGDGRMMAVEQLMSALKDDDKEGFLDALDTLIHTCEEGYDKEDKEEDY